MTNAYLTEVYQPRSISHHGIWEIGLLKFKAYGLVAQGNAITDDMLSTANQFLLDKVLVSVKSTGESNDLGFVIVHPGDLGLSISAHWWIQGCVLCHQIVRQLYTDNTPLAPATRPVVGCVWELGIINSEQEVWRKTMMVAKPDVETYLAQFAD